jgi:flagellar biosynthesis/type III secretory pathway protein FliH
MGKVIKGSSGSEERYTVAIPSLVVAPYGAFAPAAARLDDADAFIAPPEPVAPPEPQIDFAALEARAHAIIDQAERNAQALVADAERRGAALLDEAAHRAQTLAEDARRSGHDSGYADGAQEAQSSMADMIATLGAIVEGARGERHALLAAAEPELVRLAVGIAERVLHQQIALDRGVVVEMAKVAISRLVEKESVTVRVNPGDLERMREHRDELLSNGEIKNFRVVEDQRVDRGGVVVETDGGTIDARISTQVNEAKRVLHIEDEVIVPPADARESSLRAARAS